MPNYLRSKSTTFCFDKLIARTVKEYADIPRYYERVLGRIQIFKIWAEKDYPDREFYFAFDSMSKEVIVSNRKKCKRIPYRKFLRGNVSRAYLRYCSA